MSNLFLSTSMEQLLLDHNSNDRREAHHRILLALIEQAVRDTEIDVDHVHRSAAGSSSNHLIGAFNWVSAGYSCPPQIPSPLFLSPSLANLRLTHSMNDTLRLPFCDMVEHSSRKAPLASILHAQDQVPILSLPASTGYDLRIFNPSSTIGSLQVVGTVHNSESRNFRRESSLSISEDRTNPTIFLGPAESTTTMQTSTDINHCQIEAHAGVSNILLALGSNLRRHSDPYIDCLALQPAPQPSNWKGRTAKRPGSGVGAVKYFPEKLHRMLLETEKLGLSHIVSFLPHGRSFCVSDIKRFAAEVLPLFFQQTKYSSFTRQLNLWGFLRLNNCQTGSPQAASFYHELFLKGYPDLCLFIKRAGASSGTFDRRKSKFKGGNNKTSGNNDPDFSSMKPAC